jgi:serine/threonine protein kinase/Tol biopolymer transport system component
MALAAGTKLGPYEIVATLGAGGMGEVYRARDLRLRREVAIKVIPALVSSDPERLRRFEQEAMSAAALNHPNILVVFQMGTHEGAPYMVSELLDGETLREQLKQGRLALRKAIDFGIQIARGLAAAHDKGIVHRDLKPENLFITKDATVKILDFGLAKVAQVQGSWTESAITVGSETKPGVVLGTVGYMSPEQVRGEVADYRADIFAFGAILYEMLNGTRAFQKSTSAETMAAILNEEPPPTSQTGVRIPPALDRIVQHCLEKNQAQRFQSARDLVFDLEALTPPSGVVSDIQLPAVARRSWVLPTVLALLAVVAVAAAFVWRRNSGGNDTPEFRQVTFRSGTVYRARFTRDWQSILYSAAWEGEPTELFTARYGSTESRSLSPETAVAAVSSKDQLAVLLKPTLLAFGSVCFPEGTLALLPIEGGTPRPIMNDVQWADWRPDGSDLAVIRSSDNAAGGVNVLQFPRDKVLYAPERGWISDVRFSPDGKYLAFSQHVPSGDDGKVVIIDLAGKRISESPDYSSLTGLAWAPNGEVWYTAANEGSRRLLGMDLRGRAHDIYHAPGDITLHDIAGNGRILITNDSSRMLLFAGRSGSADKNLSWFNWSLALGISDDGSTVLFSESSTGVAGKSAAFLRKLDGSPAVMLGEGVGFPMALSSDGKWVATLDLKQPPNILLLPTGVGNPKQLTSNGWDYRRIRWRKSGDALIVSAREPGHPSRLYLIDISTKAVAPLLPEGITGGWPSPDGRFLLGVQNGVLKIFDQRGAEIRSLGKREPADQIDKWSEDGKSILLWSGDALPTLERMDAATGKRYRLSEIKPPDTTGMVGASYSRRAHPTAKPTCIPNTAFSRISS